MSTHHSYLNTYFVTFQGKLNLPCFLRAIVSDTDIPVEKGLLWSAIFSGSRFYFNSCFSLPLSVIDRAIKLCTGCILWALFVHRKAVATEQPQEVPASLTTPAGEQMEARIGGLQPQVVMATARARRSWNHVTIAFFSFLFFYQRVRVYQHIHYENEKDQKKEK